MSRSYKVFVSEGQEWLGENKCEVGTIYVSLANPYFYGDKFEAVIRHTQQHYKKIDIVLGGVLYHNAYFSTSVLQESIRRGLAKRFESRYKDEQLSRYEAMFLSGELSLKYAELYLEHAKNTAIHEEVHHFFNESETVKEALEKAARNFVNKHDSEDLLDEVKQHHVDMFKAFIVEELVMFAAAADKNRATYIYPGRRIDFLEDISSGFFPNTPECLLKIQSVLLTVKPMKTGSGKSKKRRMRLAQKIQVE